MGDSSQSESEGLSQLLHAEAWKLLDIARRAYMLEAFTKELNRVTRGRRFEAFNSIVWSMVFASHDLLIIDLASWAKQAYRPGGLIAVLRTHFCRAFKRKRARDSSETERRHLTDLYDSKHGESFERLFGVGTKGNITHAHFDALQERVAAQFAPIIQERDTRRAHPYEAPERASSDTICMGRLRNALDAGEELIKDLSRVAGLPIMNFGDMNMASCSVTARDLVDMILIGCSAHIAALTRKRSRDDLYAELHTRHEARGDDESPFNGSAVREGLFVEALGLND